MEKQEIVNIAKRAKQLFKDIPEDKWIEGRFTNEVDKYCAIGHWSRLTSNNPNCYQIWNCNSTKGLHEASEHFFEEGNITFVNNSLDYIIASSKGPNGNLVNIYKSFNKMYPQSTVKQRVMACLEDMINL